MKQWPNRSVAISNITYGIVSSILSIPIIAFLKFVFQSLSFFLLCIGFCLVCAFLFVLIKFVFTKKDLTKALITNEMFSREIQAIYPDEKVLIPMLITAFTKAHSIDILDLRGFIFTQQNSSLFSILSSSSDVNYRILLSDPDSANTIYRATYIPHKPIKALKKEIQASINVITDLRKSNIEIRTYCSHNVLRLIFVDETLFLTPFRNGMFLSSAPTFEISESGALYKCYKAFFQEMWDNQSNEIAVQ